MFQSWICYLKSFLMSSKRYTNVFDDIVNEIVYESVTEVCGFGGLEVACWPLVPKFAVSHPAEAVGFLRRKKSSARFPSEGK
jgi:hypothetical protein